jgi:hypothetical protein
MDITSSSTDQCSIAELTLLCKCNYYCKAGLNCIKICTENTCIVFQVRGTSVKDSVSMMTKKMTIKMWNKLKIV